ncbi:MAG: CPBP family intramembrane glutamic endopeptidase [Promethearchaeota archaeon]
MESEYRNKIIEERTSYFIEMLVVIIITIPFVLPTYLLPFLVDETLVIYAPLYRSLKALGIVFGIPIALFLIHRYLRPNPEESREASQFSPSGGFLRMFTISRANAKYQALYTLLLLFLVFVPWDVLTYLFIPELLEYYADLLSSNPLDNYVLEEFPIFLLSLVIIQISVAITEESISRGLLAKRGSEHIQVMSAVLISSIFFGLGHFFHILDPVSANYPIWYHFLWFIETFITSIVLAMFIIKKKWLIPVIFAHALNNIISIYSVWFYMQGNDFLYLVLYLYIPLLTISLILLTFQFQRVKESITTGFNIILKYFSDDNNKREITKQDKIITLLLDIALAFIIFFIAILIL